MTESSPQAFYTEGLVDGADDVQALSHVKDPRTEGDNIVDVRLASGIRLIRSAFSAQRSICILFLRNLRKATIERAMKDAEKCRLFPVWRRIFDESSRGDAKGPEALNTPAGSMLQPCLTWTGIWRF